MWACEVTETYMYNNYLYVYLVYSLVRVMQGPVCLADFEVHFNNSLDKNAREYYSSGANQQQTLRDNVEAFMRYVYVYMYV